MDNYEDKVKALFDSQLGKEVLEIWKKRTHELYGVDASSHATLAYHRGQCDFVLALEEILND